MEIKPLAGLTNTLCILLKISIFITAIAVLADVYEYFAYRNLSPNVDSNQITLPSDVASDIVGYLQVALFITIAIFFLIWIYRTNKNLHALSREQMKYTPGWSVGWYFVPIANLIMPYQVMKEIWQVSHKDPIAKPAIVGWWWCLWIISGLMDRLAVKLYSEASDAVTYAAAALVYAASDGLDVVLRIVLLVLVTKIGMAYSKNITEPGNALNRATGDKSQ